MGKSGRNIDLSQLAQAAAEDVVRRRYNAVVGIEQATEGWRGPVQSEMQNVSSALAYLRSQMSNKMRPEKPITDLTEISNPDQLHTIQTRVEPRNLGIPLPALKLIKQRRLPGRQDWQHSLSSIPRRKSIFPQWLWKRSDFQEIYRMPDEDFCIDMLMKPVENRSHFEITTSLQWIRSVGCFSRLSDNGINDLLRISTLATVRKNVLVYTRSEPVDSLFIIRTGVFELTNVYRQATGYSEQVSVGTPIGFPIDCAGAAQAKWLKRRSSSLRRWDVLRALVRSTAAVESDAVLRQDSARALSDAVLICIPYPAYAAKVADEKRRLCNRAVKMLMNMTIFSTWSTGRLYRLAARLTHVECVQKQLIVEQGSALDHVFFVESGSISLTRQIQLVRQNRWPVDRDHWERLDAIITKSFVVDHVKQGDFFGDDAAIGVKRSATSAVCLSAKCSLLLLPRSAFVHLYQPTTMRYFEMRRTQAREFAFFKVYSSLGNCSSIKNLHGLGVLDDESVAFSEPATEKRTTGSQEVVLTERGRELKCRPLTRKVVMTKTSELRPRRSRSNVNLRSTPKLAKKITQSESEALLNRLAKTSDNSFETGALIAIRAHLEALITNHAPRRNKPAIVESRSFYIRRPDYSSRALSNNETEVAPFNTILNLSTCADQ